MIFLREKNLRTLFSNTIMLYILIFSNYFFGFITIPYQSRILGPEYFGLIGFASAFIVYFQLFIDFGFILSATAEVSRHRDDKERVSKILISVIGSKLILILSSFVLLMLIGMLVPAIRDHFSLILLYFALASCNSMLPDFLYRGLERMKFITFWTVLVKFIFTIFILVFLKEREQYHLIPLLNIFAVIIILVFVYSHLFKVLKLKLVPVNLYDVFSTISKSAQFFFSRIAVSIYDATNVFLIGLMYPSSHLVGHFTSANKLVQTIRSGFSPIADSLYPYMIVNKNYKLIKKILIIIMPPVLAATLTVGIFADSICEFIFGEEFRGAAPILRALLPLVVLALPVYLLGFPSLSPLGLSRYANLSTIIGAGVQLVGLLLLFLSNWLNVYSICVLTCLSESMVLSIRIWALRRRGKVFRPVSTG